MENIWDFVEKYYPNYSSCDEIARNNDLQKIINGDLNGMAEVSYNEEYELKKFTYPFLDHDSLDRQVTRVFCQELETSNAQIYERAIKAYIESLNSTPVE